MNGIEVKEKLKKEKKVIFVCQINYNKKVYAKTLKQTRDGLEYIYYEIVNDKIQEIKDEEIIAYLKENYNGETSSILY